MKKETFILISYQELENFIQSSFPDGKGYNVVWENQWDNKSWQVIELAKEDSPENIEYGKNLTIEQIKEDLWDNGLEINNIMWSLACKGIIPFDSYLIEVFW